MMKKSFYVTPKTEALVVRFEGMFLTLSTDGNTIENATIDTWGDEL